MFYTFLILKKWQHLRDLNKYIHTYCDWWQVIIQGTNWTSIKPGMDQIYNGPA